MWHLMNLFDPILHLHFTFDPEKIEVLEEMGFFRQKLFNLEQMILSEERGPAVSGYGWVFVVNVTVMPLSKAVGVELHASSVLFGTHLYNERWWHELQMMIFLILGKGNMKNSPFGVPHVFYVTKGKMNLF